MADETYRTNDMTLAAVLVMHRYDYQLETVKSRGGRTWAHWLFPPAADQKRTQDFHEIVEGYDAVTLKVEPQLFVRTLSRIRNEMYAEIGAPDRRLRSVPSA